MNAPLTPSVRTAHASQSTSGFSRLTLGASVVAGALLCLAVQSAAAHIQDYLFNAAWHTAATRTIPARYAFNDSQQQAQLTKVLSGISGEVFAPATSRAGLDQIASARADAGLPNISPAAWDRLSAGGCITLTTKSGQMLSFRIVGSHLAGEPQHADALPKIDLAVTACTGTGEPIAKAVIEPERQQPGKTAVGQRAL